METTLKALYDAHQVRVMVRVRVRVRVRVGVRA